MATIIESRAGDYVHLQLSNDGETLTVTPGNEDRFAIKRRKLVTFLKLAAESEQFDQQLDLLMKVLAQWLSERQDVKAAFLTVGDGGLSFVAVQAGVKYSEEFNDELSSLDYDIAHDPDLDLIRLSTMALPPVEGSALGQFLNRHFTLVFNGGERS